MSIRVVTYNVLSSALCSPGYFTNVLDPKFCDPTYRLNGLYGKLLGETQQHAIICLQEVSLAWTGKLHAFFEDRGYSFIVSNYGTKFTGYMGVGIAYPRAHYELQAADIVCVADSKPGGWKIPREKNPWEEVDSVLAQKIMLPLWRGGNALGELLTSAVEKVRALIPPLRRAESPWELAKKRPNTMVCLRLHPVNHAEDGEFVVATYHMPCQFWEPAAMTIHVALAFQLVAKLAEGAPYILAGDFNMKPHSPQYALVTKGRLLSHTVDDPMDPEVNGKPTLPPGPLYPDDPFVYTSLAGGPVESAYAKALGCEPPFTNHAMTRGSAKPFTQTLDYIFYHAGTKFWLHPRWVLNVSDTCTGILGQGIRSLPSDTERSDHLLIAANFQLGESVENLD